MNKRKVHANELAIKRPTSDFGFTLAKFTQRALVGLLLGLASATVCHAQSQTGGKMRYASFEIRPGLYDISVGDESELGFGGHMAAHFTAQVGIGGGMNLFAATTFSDPDGLDARASAVRLWPFGQFQFPQMPLWVRVGPEFIGAYAGDDVGGEYVGLGLKGSVYLDIPVGTNLNAFGELGIGFNSGDTESYFSGAEGEDDLFIFDLMAGMALNETIGAGLDIQLLSADEGEDIEVFGLFARFKF